MEEAGLELLCYWWILEGSDVVIAGRQLMYKQLRPHLCHHHWAGRFGNLRFFEDRTWSYNYVTINQIKTAIL